jgi:hypothetical protein
VGPPEGPLPPPKSRGSVSLASVAYPLRCSPLGLASASRGAWPPLCLMQSVLVRPSLNRPQGVGSISNMHLALPVDDLSRLLVLGGYAQLLSCRPRLHCRQAGRQEGRHVHHDHPPVTFRHRRALRSVQSVQSIQQLLHESVPRGLGSAVSRPESIT